MCVSVRVMCVCVCRVCAVSFKHMKKYDLPIAPGRPRLLAWRYEFGLAWAACGVRGEPSFRNYLPSIQLFRFPAIEYGVTRRRGALDHCFIMAPRVCTCNMEFETKNF